MIVLTLDPAHRTGFCVAEYDTDEVTTTIITSGTFGKVAGKIENSIDTSITALFNEVNRLIKEYNPDVVGMETYFFSGRTCKGANINVELRGVIKLAVDLVNSTRDTDPITFYELNINEWKKCVAGRVRPTKECIAKYSKSTAGKYMIRDALEEKYELNFGKSVKSDEVDAIAMMIHTIKDRCDYKLTKVLQNY